jgi:hypothetical protein
MLQRAVKLRIPQGVALLDEPDVKNAVARYCSRGERAELRLCRRHLQRQRRRFNLCFAIQHLYDFANSRDGLTPTDRLISGTGNANANDYWSTNGYVTYSVRIQCRTADASSTWSGWDSDEVSIVTPPAPSSSGSAGSSSGNWTRYCDNSGFQGSTTWSASERATSYNVQVTADCV